MMLDGEHDGLKLKRHMAKMPMFNRTQCGITKLAAAIAAANDPVCVLCEQTSNTTHQTMPQPPFRQNGLSLRL